MQRFKSKGSILANKINCVVLCETKIILLGFKSKKRFYLPRRGIGTPFSRVGALST